MLIKNKLNIIEYNLYAHLGKLHFLQRDKMYGRNTWHSIFNSIKRLFILVRRWGIFFFLFLSKSITKCFAKAVESNQAVNIYHHWFIWLCNIFYVLLHHYYYYYYYYYHYYCCNNTERGMLNTHLDHSGSVHKNMRYLDFSKIFCKLFDILIYALFPAFIVTKVFNSTTFYVTRKKIIIFSLLKRYIKFIILYIK